jgi:hypothetical protein
MVIIKATCTACGEVDLKVEQIRLRIRAGEEASYSFDCPVCEDTIVKPADARIVQLLVSGGVVPEVIQDLPSNALPPITYDDLLDFHLLLESEDAIASLFDKPAHR